MRALSTLILYTIQLTDSQMLQKFSRKNSHREGRSGFYICTRKRVRFQKDSAKKISELSDRLVEGAPDSQKGAVEWGPKRPK